MKKLKNLIENNLFNSDKAKAIADYFTDMDIVLSSKFKLKDVADTIGVPEEAAFTLLMNLEHEGLMKAIAKGDYTTFDFTEPGYFNDSYQQMMRNLKL